MARQVGYRGLAGMRATVAVITVAMTIGFTSAPAPVATAARHHDGELTQIMSAIKGIGEHVTSAQAAAKQDDFKDVVTDANAAAGAKLDLIDTHFTAEIWGVPANTLYHYFECAGLLLQLTAHEADEQKPNKREMSDRLDTIDNCLTRLEDLLENNAPLSFGALEKVRKEVDEAAKALAKGRYRNVRYHCLEAGAVELRVVNFYLTTTFESVPFNEIYMELARIDEELTLASEEARATNPNGKLVSVHVKAAAFAVEQLEHAFTVLRMARLTGRFYPPGSQGCDTTASLPNNGETCYGATAVHGTGPKQYAWGLVPPVLDPTCNHLHTVAPTEVAWHHGDVDACHHELQNPDVGHAGVVYATVRDKHTTCIAFYIGTEKGIAPRATCVPGSGRVLVVVKVSYGDPAADGTVTQNETGCPPGCSYSVHDYSSGATVKLIEFPLQESRFAGWGGACSGKEPCSVTMDADKVVLASFEPK